MRPGRRGAATCSRFEVVPSPGLPPVARPEDSVPMRPPRGRRSPASLVALARRGGSAAAACLGASEPVPSAAVGALGPPDWCAGLAGAPPTVPLLSPPLPSSHVGPLLAPCANGGGICEPLLLPARPATASLVSAWVVRAFGTAVSLTSFSGRVGSRVRRCDAGAPPDAADPAVRERLRHCTGRSGCVAGGRRVPPGDANPAPDA